MEKLKKRMEVYKYHPFSLVLRLLMVIATIFTVGITVCLVGYILIKGIPNLTLEQFAWEYNTDNVSMLPAIINTVLMVILVLIFAVPVGVGAAIYLVEYAKKGNKLVKIVRVTTETLQGIPSIVYGLFGYLFFAVFFGWGYTFLGGALTLAIMILPNILRTTQEALKTVPQSYREGSVGLGATKWHTIRTIVLPCTLDGVVGGAILAIGKIVGESAALLYTAGAGYKLVTNYFQALGTSGGSLSVMLYVYFQEQGKIDLGFAIAAILMIIVLIINGCAKLAKKKLKRV